MQLYWHPTGLLHPNISEDYTQRFLMALELQRHLHPVGHYGSLHSSSSLTGGAKGFLLQLRERIGLNGIPAEMKHAGATA
jgi:hypothetical protein